jgi:predicted DNA-binding ribbon-helix-helix protein
MIKLNKKMFEPFEGPVTIKKGNGRRVSYITVKRFTDNLKEIAAKKRTSIAAILSEHSQNKES